MYRIKYVVALKKKNCTVVNSSIFFLNQQRTVLDNIHQLNYNIVINIFG